MTATGAAGAALAAWETWKERNDVGSVDRGAKRLAAVLVGDGQDRDRPAVGCLVDEEVERPHLVRAGRGQVAWHPLPSPTSTGLRRQAQPLIAPQPLHSFAVAGPALAGSDFGEPHRLPRLPSPYFFFFAALPSVTMS